MSIHWEMKALFFFLYLTVLRMPTLFFYGRLDRSSQMSSNRSKFVLSVLLCESILTYVPNTMTYKLNPETARDRLLIR
jgi:hypothetical protein